MTGQIEHIARERDTTPSLIYVLAPPFSAHFGLIILLGVLSFSLYQPALHGPFIFDDKTSIEYAKELHLTSLNFESINRLLSHISPRRAIPNISFALNYFLHGLQPFGYHLVNSIIHILVGYLFFLVAFDTLSRLRPKASLNSSLLLAGAAAVLWAIHPIQTQSVSYIVQRMNSMAALFFLCSLYCYIHGRQRTGRTRLLLFLFSGVSGIAAFLSKEHSAVLPCILLLYEWYFLQDANPRFFFKKSFWLALLFILTGAVVLFMSMDVMTSINKWYTVQPFTMEERLLTELRALFFYLGQLLYPHPTRLSLEHDFPISTTLFEPITTLTSLIGVVALVILAALSTKKYRLLSFSLFWYLGTLFIESSFIGLAPIYEHRLYLPSMFVFLALLDCGRRILSRPWLRALFFVALLIPLCMWTYQRNILWGNEYLFGRDAVGKTPDLGRVHYNFAKTLESMKRFDEAIVEYTETLRCQPGNAYAHNNLGAIYQDRGQVDKAIYHFKRAVQLKPNNEIARGNLRFLMIYKERQKKQRSHGKR